MRILVVYEYYLRHNEGGIGRMNRLVRELRRLGHDVTVITGSVNYMSGSTQKWHWGALVRRDPEDGQILRCYIPSSYRRNYGGRIVSYALFTLEAIWSGIVHVKGCDVIVASSPPLSTAMVGRLLSIAKHAPWVFEVRDLWPASAIELGGLRSRLAVWLARILESRSYSTARALIALSPVFGEILSRQNVPAQKVHFIPNGVEIPESSVATSAARQQLPELRGLEGSFLVVYTGAHGLANALEQVVDAAALLKDHEDIAFVFVGDGMYRESLMGRARDAGLERVRFVGAQPQSRTDLFIQAADLCLISLRNVPVFRSVYPSKLADYMRFGKPVLAAADGAVRQFIEDARCGWCVTPQDPHALSEAVLLASRAGNGLLDAGSRGRKVAEQVFSLDTVVRSYLGVLERVFDGSLGVTQIGGPVMGSQRRLLIVSSRPPFERDSGFKVRVFNSGVLLRHAGWSVDLLAIADNRGQEFSESQLGGSCDQLFLYDPDRWRFRLNLLRGIMSALPMQVWYYRFPALMRWARAHAGDYDVVLLNHARMAQYGLAAGPPCVLDLHDSIGLNYERERAVATSITRRAAYWLEGRRISRYEAAICSKSGHVFVTSGVDRDFIERHGAKRGTVEVLPVAVRPEVIDYADQDESELPTCCFIGRMGYAPNVAAVCFFALQVLPLIRKEIPEVTFDIVGADPAPAVLALQRIQGIRVTGHMADPYALVGRCWVFVAPMVSGSGVQNKILEALVLRRAVVTTQLGSMGIPGLENDINALLADTAQAFADATVRLMRDSVLRQRLGRAGKELVLTRYSWEVIGGALISAVNDTAGGRGGPSLARTADDGRMAYGVDATQRDRQEE
jgi:glycosyltransferase involved in cell wall biosynthesis